PGRGARLRAGSRARRLVGCRSGGRLAARGELIDSGGEERELIFGGSALGAARLDDVVTQQTTVVTSGRRQSNPGADPEAGLAIFVMAAHRREVSEGDLALCPHDL